jgi:hypothetical protein
VADAPAPDAPPAPGPWLAVEHTPARVPGSARRTSTIDSRRSDDDPQLLLVTARARDLRTDLAGAAEVVDEVTLHLVLAGFAREIVDIEAVPLRVGLDLLRGAMVAGGLGRALAGLPPDAAPAGGLLHFLLDDLSGAAMVAGYADLHAGRLPQRTNPDQMRNHLRGQRDLCAGWAADAGMMQAAERDGTVPVPGGPPAPTLERADDPLAWHTMAELPSDGMRRRRRLDLCGDRFDVHFRDSHAAPDGERVLHEYTLTGTLEDPGGADGAGTATIASLEATARVLPWAECPGAIASAQRVVGHTLDELPVLVRRDFRGTSTCTHLNSSLRSLAALSALRALAG